MVKFSMSVFRNVSSPLSLNMFYWPPLIWASHPLYFHLYFASKQRWVVFSVLAATFIFQLPKFGRIKMLLGLSATLQSIR